jgi:hypothetical protein
MGLPRSPFRLLVPALLLPALAFVLAPGAAQAGPLVRRAQERRACQEFAGKLQQASGNPAMVQQVYQQGVLQLVQRFGENPCGDIPAPTATGVAPATAPSAGPAGTAATTGAAKAAPMTAPAAATPPTPSASGAASGAAPARAQQQQACQQFAGKLQAAAASGGAAAAQQTYAMGLQKLSGLFGPNPCPAVKAPQ